MPTQSQATDFLGTVRSYTTEGESYIDARFKVGDSHQDFTVDHLQRISTPEGNAASRETIIRDAKDQGGDLSWRTFPPSVEAVTAALAAIEESKVTGKTAFTKHYTHGGAGGPSGPSGPSCGSGGGHGGYGGVGGGGSQHERPGFGGRSGAAHAPQVA